MTIMLMIAYEYPRLSAACQKVSIDSSDLVIYNRVVMIVPNLSDHQ